jgi:hypothetical protein
MGPHQCGAKDDEGGSGELGNGSADIRGGLGRDVDGE